MTRQALGLGVLLGLVACSDADTAEHPLTAAASPKAQGSTVAGQPAPTVDASQRWLGGTAVTGDFARLGDYDVEQAAARWTGAAKDDQAGAALALVDLDDDGLAELVTGARYLDSGASGGGGVHVVTDSMAGGVLGGQLTVHDDGQNAFAGWHIANVGDVDGDGRSDLAVGAPGADDAGTDAGGVWLLTDGLPAGGSLVDAASWIPGEVGQQWGVVLTGGDVVGDARAELVFATNQAVVVMDDAGNELASLHAVSGDEALGGRSGLATADLDGDGVDELLVGAPGLSGAGLNGDGHGAVAVFSGPLQRELSLDDADGLWTGTEAWSRVGQAVATGADVTGDGRIDAVVGAEYGAGLAGQAFVVSGSMVETSGAIDALAAAELVGASANDFLGWSVASGDVTADGQADVVVGLCSV